MDCVSSIHRRMPQNVYNCLLANGYNSGQILNLFCASTDQHRIIKTRSYDRDRITAADRTV